MLNFGDMKCLVSLSIIFIQVTTGWTQGQNDNWIIDYQTVMNLDVNPPSFLNCASNMPGSAVSDPDGAILFYSDGYHVYNRNHTLMQNGHLNDVPPLDIVGTDHTGYAASFVKSPSNPNQFYLIRNADSVHYDGSGIPELHAHIDYSIIDMSLNGGLGGITTVKKELLMDNHRLIGIALGRRCGEYWIIVISELNGIGTIKLDSNGFGAVNYSPLASDFIYHGPKLHGKNILYGGFMNKVGFAILDPVTGTISDFNHIILPDVFMGDTLKYLSPFLSPDGNKLYVNYSAGEYRERLCQLDLHDFFDSGEADTAAMLNVSTTPSIYMSTIDLLRNELYLLTRTRGGADGHEVFLKKIANPDQNAMQIQLETIATLYYSRDKYDPAFGNQIPIPAYAHQRTNRMINLELCEGSSLHLQPSITADNYYWSNYEETKNISVRDSGIYTVKSFSECEIVVDSYHVTILPAMVNITTPDTLICTANEKSFDLSAEGNTKNIVWNTGETTDYITITESGLYSVTVQNECGVFSDSVRIMFDPDCSCMPLIPSAFSPNGDGLNDKLEIKTRCLEQNMAMHIFNRYGQKIFHIFSSNQSWDGTINGRPAPADVYYYMLSFETRDGRKMHKRGDITLIR